MTNQPYQYVDCTPRVRSVYNNSKDKITMRQYFTSMSNFKNSKLLCMKYMIITVIFTG